MVGSYQLSVISEKSVKPRLDATNQEVLELFSCFEAQL